MDRLAGKIYVVQKKHLKMPKIMDNFSDRLTLDGAGGRNVFWIKGGQLGPPVSDITFFLLT